MKRSFIFLFLLLGSASVLSSEVIQQGLLRLEYSRDGSFTLQGASDINRPRFFPLFFSEDRSTSYFTLWLHDRMVNLRPGRDFELTINESPQGLRFTWQNSRLTIQQDFLFYSSVDNQAVDSLKIEFTMTNTGREALLLGLKWLLDTNLGESTANHFQVGGNEQISRERQWTGGFPQNLLSGSSQRGLRVDLSSENATLPQSLSLANWRRLSESSWDFEARNDRDFHLLPYSHNDSAVELKYPIEVLRAGDSREISFMIGLGNINTFVGAVPASLGIPALGAETNTTLGTQELLNHILTEQRSIQDLLSEINQILNSGRALDSAELRALQERVRELEGRRPTNPIGLETQAPRGN